MVTTRSVLDTLELVTDTRPPADQWLPRLLTMSARVVQKFLRLSIVSVSLRTSRPTVRLPVAENVTFQLSVVRLPKKSSWYERLWTACWPLKLPLPLTRKTQKFQGSLPGETPPVTCGRTDVMSSSFDADVAAA